MFQYAKVVLLWKTCDSPLGRGEGNLELGGGASHFLR